jgi:L-alanine-DL-glutamate epimerase-like enolase superfamily enzyme
MKITEVSATRFRYRSRVVRDEEGHTHPGPEHDAIQTLTTVKTDEGVEGHAFGGSPELAALCTQILAGENPLDREKIWQRLRQNQRSERRLLDDRNMGVVDQALWDFAGCLTGLPVYRLIGGFRDRVPAYASTMCGDDIPGGLDTPEAYGRFALACKERGYRAFKLHTWMWPLGPDARRDVAACAAVREAVGPDMHLMLDCHHDYSREEALYIGRELERLGYHWLEEPMPEHSVSSYVWLTEQLDLPVVGPETAEGKMYTRAEWIVRGASDISRGGVSDVGGITPLLKIAHLCESFGVAMEVHGGGAGNLHVLCAMGIPGEYYERGLLHPMLDYEAQTPWLREIADPLDAEGYVHVSQRPGLGHDVDWDYIRENAVE